MALNNLDLPIIFILDIDNTLIGNSKPIIDFRNLINFIKDSCNRNKFTDSKEICKISEKIFEDKISEYFFRPYMKEFLIGIKDTYKNAEFFVFSTGIAKYVKIMITYINKHLDNKIKINKPYFTREKSFKTDNLSFVKDINYYDNEIIKALKSKYPKIQKNITEVLNERTIIIDDLEVWDNDYRHIKMKPYTFEPIIEFDYLLIKQIYENQNLYNFVINSKILDIEGNTLYDFLFNYHLYMMNLYKNAESNNLEQIKDNEFDKLLKIITKLKNRKDNIFTKKNIDYIKKELNKEKK